MISSATTSPLPRPVRSTRIVTLPILAIVLAFGCSESSTGMGGTNGAAPFSGAALCSLVFGPDGAAGFIRLVSDAELEASEETGEVIDSVEDAVEIAGGGTCAVRGRSVFVTSAESPTITRFDEVDGKLVQRERVSFANFGTTSTGDPPVLISETKAYYVDSPSSQVIVWDPSAIETIGAFPLTVVDPPEGVTQQRLRINLIGDLVLVYNQYGNAQETGVSRADFWFIDPQTDEVVATDVTEECGNLGRTVATATNGDIYLATQAGIAMEDALGSAESFPPCIVRIRAGSREIDRSYPADLNALTGLPTSGITPSGNNRGVLVAYDTSSMPVDPNLTADEHVQLENWNLYEWELGSDQPASLVESIAAGTGRVDTRDFEGRTFLFRSAPDFSTSELLDLTQRPVEVTYTLANVTVALGRLGSEPAARMAQRIEH